MKKFAVIISLFFLVNNFALAVDYSKYDRNDINSIVKATKAFQKEFDKKRGTKEAEEDFLRFENFYYSAVYAQRYTIYLPTPEKPYKNSTYWQARKYTNDYAIYGLGVEYTGRRYKIKHNSEYIYLKFSPYLSEDWQELLMFYSILYSKEVIRDGKYVISKQELIQISDFDKYFCKKYPTHRHCEDIEYFIESDQKRIDSYPNIDY